MILSIFCLSSVIYFLFLLRQNKINRINKRKKRKKKSKINNGIWKVSKGDNITMDSGKEKSELLVKHGIKLPLYALYFSLLSAFNIGWKGLNINNWINRIQCKEYTLKATGWARTIAGAQSLLSVYLLALFVLCYFSDPFKW